MKLPNRFTFGDWLAGIFLILAIVLTVVGLGWSVAQGILFQQYTAVPLKAESADSIAAGMPVVYKGLSIGQIDEVLLLDNSDIQVNLRIQQEEMRWIKDDSRFFLESAPLIGLGRVVVETDRSSQRAYSRSIIFNLERPASLLDSLQPKAEEALDQIVPILKSVERLLGQINGEDSGPVLELLDLLAELLQLQNSEGFLSAILGDASYGDVSKILRDAQMTLQETRSEFLSGDKHLLHDVRGILVNTESVLSALVPSMHSLEQAMANLGESTEGLDSIKKEIELTLLSVQELVQKVNQLVPGGTSEVELP